MEHDVDPYVIECLSYNEPLEKLFERKTFEAAQYMNAGKYEAAIVALKTAQRTERHALKAINDFEGNDVHTLLSQEKQHIRLRYIYALIRFAGLAHRLGDYKCAKRMYARVTDLCNDPFFVLPVQIDYFLPETGGQLRRPWWQKITRPNNYLFEPPSEPRGLRQHLVSLWEKMQTAIIYHL